MTSGQRPTEKEIHDKAFLDLRRPDNWLLYNFLGWHYREKIRGPEGKVVNHTPKTNLYREFDLLDFAKQDSQLVLTGYEVKGYTRSKNKLIPPQVGEGIGQVLTYLLQGVDFGYLILPKPEEERAQEGWKNLCDKYAPQVGLRYYFSNDGTFVTLRLPQRNTYSDRDRKRDLLTSASVHGTYDECTPIPLWIKKREFP